MDALLAWAETTNAAPKSALGKAVYYLKEQWPYLIRVLEDGRLELSNNLAERSIKPFVIGRKNFLFANTPWGAQGSAVIYSMIEAAKESGLDPYRYLTWLLTNAPILAARDDSWRTSSCQPTPRQTAILYNRTPDLKWTALVESVHFSTHLTLTLISR